MDHEFRSPGVTGLLVLVLPLIALFCIAGIALSADAALTDNETLPNPQQYYDWDHAYNVDERYDINVPITVRKDGGGDDDYLKLAFLLANDYVTITVNQSEPTTVVEYWVSDPNHFPILFFHYVGGGQSPNFTLEFAVLIAGPYFFHTGQGFGDTFMNVTFHIDEDITPPAAKDSNNAPNQKVLLSDGVTHRENAGNPWDPSDFFFINIQPTLLVNKYLTITMETEKDTKVQWELYDSSGIQRPSEIYTSDTISFGSGLIKDKRIMEAGDYIIRVWMMEGYGQYNITLSVLSYPNDQDNSIDEATLVGDESTKTGDVNLSFDRDDYYEIYLEAGMPLWVRMVPQDGPADLYIFDALENQKRASRRDGLQEEFIAGWRPDEAGYYYIVVEAVYEAPLYENPPTVSYTLEVWINYAPERVQSPVRHIHVDEDEIDYGSYDVSKQFQDEDGDLLLYELDMSYNDTLIDIQLQTNNTLRIEPVANASGFNIPILLNATDPRGLWVNLTVTVWVDPVNDEPTVNWSLVPEEITMGEDLVKSGVNVTKAFEDIDDDYSTWTFTATSADHIGVELDEQWLATFEPLLENWFGVETFTVVCTDKEGATASIEFTINMYEINDPPKLVRYIQPTDLDEEDSFSVDLMDSVNGDYFVDPEGKPLTYHFKDNQTVTVTIEGSVVTFTGQKDATGLVNTLKIWAEDDLGAPSFCMTVVIDLINIPDDPEVTPIIETATVQEGEAITFAKDVYYTFNDIDSTQYELEWKWFIDGEEVPPAEITDIYAFEYVPPVTAAKDRTVTVRLLVIDDAGEDDAEWTVTVTNKNVQPDLPKVSAEGFNVGTVPSIKEGTAITFNANATDLDGDALTFKWFLDELTEVGQGPTLVLKDVKPGTHKVTVEVSDGTMTAEESMEFKVTKKKDSDDSPGFGTALVAMALLLTVGVMAVRRRL